MFQTLHFWRITLSSLFHLICSFVYRYGAHTPVPLTSRSLLNVDCCSLIGVYDFPFPILASVFFPSETSVLRTQWRRDHHPVNKEKRSITKVMISGRRSQFIYLLCVCVCGGGEGTRGELQFLLSITLEADSQIFFYS